MRLPYTSPTTKTIELNKQCAQIQSIFAMHALHMTTLGKENAKG
jgi:hypothetical protein